MFSTSGTEKAQPIDVLATYELLAEVTGRMRTAAAEEDWDRVIALESECSSVYDKLLAIDQAGTPPSADYQKRKAELICRLLDDDAHIRERVSGQLSRVWRLLDGGTTVNRLNSAYGFQAGALNARE